MPFPFTDANDIMQELSKITFTYYGTSPAHLLEVLRLDGVELSCSDAIQKQDPNAEKRCKFWSSLPSLIDICFSGSDRVKQNYKIVPNRKFPIRDKWVGTTGRRRSVYKRYAESVSIFIKRLVYLCLPFFVRG